MCKCISVHAILNIEENVLDFRKILIVYHFIVVLPTLQWTSLFFFKKRDFTDYIFVFLLHMCSRYGYISIWEINLLFLNLMQALFIFCMFNA